MAEPKVSCIGELLIDMFCTDVDVALKDGENFRKMAGGAPANVAATVSRLGGSASFSGKVGNDSFGDFLIETLEEYQVDTSMIVKDAELPTTIAFVSLTKDGERDFQFNRGADRNLTMEDVPLDKILESDVLHFGSATALLEGSTHDTYLALMDKANDRGILTSFDPNFRQDLWKGNQEAFITQSKRAIGKTDFIKVSDEELQLITGESDYDKGITRLHQLGASIVTVTLGKEGSILSNGENQELIPSKKVEAVDATGAGDAFVGAMMHQLAQRTEKEELFLDFDFLKEAVRFANNVGAEVCTQVGSLTALSAIAEEL